MAKRPNLLLICYDFPPSKAIGGKRWYNLAQYLHQFYHIHLITFTPSVNEPFIKEVYYVKSKYWSKFNRTPQTFFQKAEYTIREYIQKERTQGSFYDKASRNIKDVQTLIKSIHKKNPLSYIITTGAPFSLPYFSVQLKSNKDFINTKFISDLRDPWTWGKHKGIIQISADRQSVEKNREKETILNSNLVLVPNSEMKNHLEAKYKNINISIVQHGFNKDVIDEIPFRNAEIDHKIKIIYAGSMYNGIENILRQINELISQNESIDTFDFHTKPSTFNFEDEKHSKTKILPYLPETSIFNKIKNSDIYLIIFPSHLKNTISAKFYEIIYLRTPILFIGDEGEVSNFIKKHNLGEHLALDNLDELNTLILKMKNTSYTFDIEIAHYTFSSLTERLIKLISDL